MQVIKYEINTGQIRKPECFVSIQKKISWSEYHCSDTIWITDTSEYQTSLTARFQYKAVIRIPFVVILVVRNIMAKIHQTLLSLFLFKQSFSLGKW